MILNILRKIIVPKNLSQNVKCNYSCIGTMSNTKEKPGRVVFISQSTDIFSNLAFEDWLYRNWNFNKRDILLLWRNSPSVVIGRHQNPFVEANIEYLQSAGVPLARRHSGGGTVYHDEGNLNCTFFTSRERYNRKWNLTLICNALSSSFDISAKMNKKDDIVVGNELKISGTAAKLGRLCAYHHCTLLVSSDKLQLKLALKGDKSLKSKATESVPSSVANLTDFAPLLSVEKLIECIGRTFLEQCPPEEHGRAPPSVYKSSDGFTLINPIEEWFPGIDALKSNLKSWEWLYGMTPSFTQARTVTSYHSLSETSAALVSMKIVRGRIERVEVDADSDLTLRSTIETLIGRHLQGAKYSPEVFMEIESRLIESRIKPEYSSAS